MTDVPVNAPLSLMRPDGPAPLAGGDLSHISGGRSEGGCIIGNVKVTFPSQQQK